MLKTIKAAVLILSVVALCAPVFAQDSVNLTGNDTGPGVYQVNYFSNKLTGQGAPDQFVRIINTGAAGDPLSYDEGPVCANIYMFDHQQEMLECCSCPLTANDLLTLSVNQHLMQNPLTGAPGPSEGVIKIVSDQKSKCSAEVLNYPKFQLAAFGTHLQQPVLNNFFTTETAFTPAELSWQERDFLPLACSFVRFLGSGKGRCDCGPPDFQH